MILNELYKKQLISPPKFLLTNCPYLTIMGSVAYGVSSDTSDMDIYGYCIPNKGMLFPHILGEIPGFGKQKKRFNQWQQHHINYKDKEYDFSVYSIVQYFDLLMSGNPNIVNSIFTPANCVIHSTQIGELVRENRKIFLHKGCFHKFKGYAYSQQAKMRTKQAEPGSKRYADIQKHGYDTKFGYHLVRLLGEVEQILTTGDLDLQKNREQLKSIRRGEWAEQDIYDYFAEKEKGLEKIYEESKLPWGPDEKAIKDLLLQCLEIQYGSLSEIIHIEKKPEKVIHEICETLRKYNYNL